MSQNTNLNISPYFDDFDESKRYNKVLFKPGFPVQARELTTLQTILQNQIERFGQYFFKEGTVVVPGGTTLDTQYFAVRIDPEFLNIPVNLYTKELVDNNIKIKGETSGVTATVVNRLTEIESSDNFNTLYVKYNSSGDGGERKTFLDGENLIALSDIDYSTTKIAANSSFASCISTGATKIGSSVSISEGIYFLRGFFVKTPKETLILDQYTNTPSYKIGLTVTESLVTASSVNRDLYDNAQGFSNEAAPGADRFSLATTLSKKLLTDPDDKSFVELMRIENGTVKKHEEVTDFNYFEDALARRTYDESGDYYVRPFSIDVRESLNDRLGNNGLYFDTQVTQNGNTPSDDVFCLQMSAGKAYVRGYEIGKSGTTAIDVIKPRTKKTKKNKALPIKIGNIVTVNNVKGSPIIGFSSSSDYSIDLLDRRQQSIAGGVLAGGREIIGKARVFDWNESNSGISSTKEAQRFDIRLFDIQTFTKITVGLALTISAHDHVEGKYSGASGFSFNTTNNTTSICLNDVSGEFQINEPLLINGRDVGRNVGVATDYDFESVKAIGISTQLSGTNTGVGNTFTADLVLDKAKKVFPENIEFQFTRASNTNSGISTVTSAAISDFRTYLKVGDIIRWDNREVGVSTIASYGLPSFAKVNVVNEDNFIVDSESEVPGVNRGFLPSVVAGTKTTELDVLVPRLNQAEQPGYRIPIQNDNIASLNLLDSSYIVRKQFTKSTGANGEVTFNISDLGDQNPETLVFEGFDADDFVLIQNFPTSVWPNHTGHREELVEGQVEFASDYTWIKLKGLAGSKSYTFTTTLKRRSLVTKTKDITRCSTLVVDKSINSGSGIGSTTLNDGLTYSAGGYGLRVQDKEISLNVADGHRVLGVFESNNTDEPSLPTITSTNASDVFDNDNVIVGEQFIGNISGAIGRVVRIVTASQFEFVYENDEEFEIGEDFTLKTSGIIANISVLLTGDRDIRSSFELDKGHREEFVDYARLIRRDDTEAPSNKLKIVFDYYQNTESSGSIETITSYDGLDYTNEIPFVIDDRASDFIDLRPRVDAYSGTSSPFSFVNRKFNTTGSETLVSNKTVFADYSYYLGRIDRLYLTKDGIFELKEGEPAEDPKPPIPNDEGFEVAMLTMEPYMYNSTDNCKIMLVPHKRYTMTDIGNLEGRIKTLEEYTSLSLLETDTKNLAIKDPNTGLDKFKSGFFVDNFRNHKKRNFRGQSNYDIDKRRGECRPRSTERQFALKFETKSSKLDPINTDYRFNSDFDDENITRSGSGLTLKYDNVTFIEQPLATRVENLNPFAVTNYTGILELTPEADYWIDEVVADQPEVINIGDNSFEAIALLLGVDGENGGMADGQWNTTETTWGASSTSTSTRTENRTNSSSTNDFGRRVTRTETTTTTDRITNSVTTQSGVEREFALELTSHTETQQLANKVTGFETVFNCRSRNVEVVATRLKPNTKYYVFMENIDVTKYCIPKLLPITMLKGSFNTGDILTAKRRRRRRGNQNNAVEFRLAQANHKYGRFNNPSETYTVQPSDQKTLTNSYSATSTTVNVDTFDLSSMRDSDRIGWVRKGQLLVEELTGAEARVETLALMSDEFGELIFSYCIPDPSRNSNPTFRTGLSTIKVTSDPNNSEILDPGESTAEGTYLASGHTQYSVEQTLSIKSPKIERREIRSQPVSRITERNTVRETIDQRTTVSEQGWGDPIAQSFIVPRDDYQDGVFITGGSLYFKTKDSSDVTVQIRELDDGGRPSTTVVPFGQTKIKSSLAGISTDGQTPTNFEFPTPVYLESDGRYALVLITPELGWNTFITRMGEVDVFSNRINDKQPSLGSLFKSQNGELWTASQTEDLKFKLNKAWFVTGQKSALILNNAKLPWGKIRKENPVTAYSKTQTVGIGTTTRTFLEGTTITQGSNSGNVIKSGGPLYPSNDVNTTGVVTFAHSATGIGITPTSGTLTYTGIAFTSLSGFGEGAIGSVRVKDGKVDRITITSSGGGYQAGDSLISGNVGLTGSQVRAVVGVVTVTDTLIVNNLKNDISVGTAFTHIDGNSGIKTYTDGPLDVTSDPIKDGKTIKISHRNHGMHSKTNKVRIKSFDSDIAPVILSTKIDDDTTTIKVSSASTFAQFGGQTVGSGKTGYIEVGKEIIGYESVDTTRNELGSLTRSIDESTKSDHDANDYVSKYEFNGVSLRSINTTHNMADKPIRANDYYITIVGTEMFQTTKIGGGSNLRVSQNIPFEAINPKISLISPSGTTVTSRIKTTSGTSISGNESSFSDLGYENVSLNRLNLLDSPRIIASRTNEYNLLDNEESFALELVLSTNNRNVSPMIDLDTTRCIAISNLVDDEITDYRIDPDPRSVKRRSGKTSAIYETGRINLEFPSNSLQVMFDGHREEGANFRVFYKLFRDDEGNANQSYIPFNVGIGASVRESNVGGPDKFVSPNTRRNRFSEYKYTTDNTAPFNGFMVKVIMTSKDQSKPPRFKNFRAIALNSYQG